MIKLLGIADVIFGTLLMFGNILPQLTLFCTGIYLIIKGLSFSFFGEWAIYFDVVIGAYAVLASQGYSFVVLNVLSALYLLQKGILSLI